MPNRNDVAEAVFAAVDELNDMLPDGEQLSKDESTPLTGDHAALKSLSLANLLVGIEEQVEERLDQSISIIGGDPLPDDPAPLDTLGTLIDYVALLVESALS